MIEILSFTIRTGLTYVIVPILGLMIMHKAYHLYQDYTQTYPEIDLGGW